MDQKSHAYLIDGIKAIAKHNGVIRIEFMRLGMDGSPMPAVELQIPSASLQGVVEALRKIT